MDPMATDPAAEVARLKGEVQAKEEALNALKAKTKAFVDNMRSQLSNETKKVSALEEKLKEATSAAAAASVVPVDNGSVAEQQLLSEDIEKLKKETAARENEFKARAKSFADSMNSQLEAERQKSRNLETQLQQMTEALAVAEAAKAAVDHAKEMDFLSQPVAAGTHTDDEFNALQSQLNTANFEMVDLRERLRSVEAEAAQSVQQVASLRQELDALRISADQQRNQLQAEVEALKAREVSLQAELSSQQTRMKAEENSLEAEAKTKEMEFQLEQHKIENQHLQKQLSDKDFQLEQLDNYRRRADDSESKVLQSQAEISSLQNQLKAKCDELTSHSCGKCTDLEEKLAEITQLYEKVNLGRSRSDSLIAETQSQLGEMQTIKQQYLASQERLDDMMQQNLKLNEKISEKEIEVTTLKAEMKKWSMEMAELQAQHSSLKSDSTEHRQRSDSVHADFQKAETSLKELHTKCTQLEKKNQELTSSIETINKENTDKRQKAKALVQSLVSEKTTLVESRSALQKEVDRLRMEVNQRNVDNDQQVKQLREETNEKAAQSASTIQSLTDEVASLKHALTTVQESEKVQQRAKELAAAKREIEDSNKKRLAAKAETQKLAVELENVHKCLDHITTHVNANCTENIQQIALVQGHVKEALEVLEKRAGVGTQGKQQRPEDDTAEIVRKAEALRSGNGQQNPGAKRLEENVSRVSEQIRQLVDITERLCDIAVEQNDANLKDVIINKLGQTFTQCFSEKLKTVYSKADEAVSLLDAHGPTSESGHAAVRPTS